MLRHGLKHAHGRLDEEFQADVEGFTVPMPYGVFRNQALYQIHAFFAMAIGAQNMTAEPIVSVTVCVVVLGKPR